LFFSEFLYSVENIGVHEPFAALPEKGNFMKSLILALALLVSGSVHATSVYCHAKTFTGDLVAVSYCIPMPQADFVNAFAPCAGEKTANVTLTYFTGVDSGVELDPIISTLPASQFDISVDEELMVVAAKEGSAIGAFNLTYANMPDYRSSNGLNYNLVNDGMTFSGSFKHVSCTYDVSQ
jgi:hypothetical protein